MNAATNAAQLDATFGALADSTRREILRRLTDGPSSVTELAEPFDMSLPAVSKHLKVLERAGLISRQRQGRVHRIELVPDQLGGASEWIDSCSMFWQERLDALEHFLDRSQLGPASLEPEEPGEGGDVTDPE